MIEVEMNYGEEEYRVLSALLIDSPKNKRALKIWKILLFLVGLVQLIIGAYNLLTTSTWMSAFGIVTAALAFFLAFYGKKLLVRYASLRRGSKAKGKGGFRKFTISGKGCIITSENGTDKYKWDVFEDYAEYSHYLWIRRNDNHYILIDMQKLSQSDGDLLRKYCQEKLKVKAGS